MLTVDRLSWSSWKVRDMFCPFAWEYVKQVSNKVIPVTSRTTPRDANSLWESLPLGFLAWTSMKSRLTRPLHFPYPFLLLSQPLPSLLLLTSSAYMQNRLLQPPLCLPRMQRCLPLILLTFLGFLDWSWCHVPLDLHDSIDHDWTWLNAINLADIK